MGLSTMDTMDVEVQGRFALESHIRTRDGGGHGKKEAYPRGFDPDDLLDYIETGDDAMEDSHTLAP